MRIDVLLSGAVTCDFTGTESVRVVESGEFDSQWHSAAKCSCTACSWQGVVADAAEKDDELQPAPPLEEELVEIEQELAAGHCPPPLADTVRALLESVRSLRAQLRVADNLAGRRPRDDGDTTIS